MAARLIISTLISSISGGIRLFVASQAARKESKMPKLKTKSGAKKRFKITARAR